MRAEFQRAGSLTLSHLGHTHYFFLAKLLHGCLKSSALKVAYILPENILPYIPPVWRVQLNQVFVQQRRLTKYKKLFQPLWLYFANHGLKKVNNKSCLRKFPLPFFGSLSSASFCTNSFQSVGISQMIL